MAKFKRYYKHRELSLKTGLSLSFPFHEMGSETLIMALS